MQFEEDAKSILKSKGFRFTKQRELTLKTLATANKPINAYKLAETVGIDTVTAYRILDVYLQLGLIHKTANGFTACREFQCSNQSHCHHQFICTKCERIEELHLEDKDFIKQLSKNNPKVTIQSHHFEFTGLCNSCLK